MRKIHKYQPLPHDLDFMADLIQMPTSPRFFIVADGDVVTWEEGAYAWRNTIVPMLRQMVAEREAR